MSKPTKIYNPARRIALYCWIGAAFGTAMVIYPLVFSIDTYGAGYALIFAGIIVFLSALISGFVFAVVARRFDSMFSGKGLLVHWTYAPEEWARYTEAEHLRDRQDKWGLFRLIAIIAGVIGIGFAFFKPEVWRIMLVLIAGLILFTAFVAWASVASAYRQNRKHLGEIYIGTSGALVGRSLHYWELPVSYLHSVLYQEDPDPYLELVYSAQSGMARGIYKARIPIPRGREDEARKVVAALSQVPAD